VLVTFVRILLLYVALTRNHRATNQVKIFGETRDYDDFKKSLIFLNTVWIWIF